jgi:prepilin-type processing-associated H-X9-DG protein
LQNLELGDIGFYSNAYGALLPFIEQDSIKNVTIKDRPWHEQTIPYISAVIQILECPSNAGKDNPVREPFILEFIQAAVDELDDGGSFEWEGGEAFGLADYALCKGVSDAWCVSPAAINDWAYINTSNNDATSATTERGMFDISLPDEFELPGSSFACSDRQIGDGMSNTIAVGEAAQGEKWKLCGDVREWGDPCLLTSAFPHPHDPSLDMPTYNIWHAPPSVTPIAEAGIHIGGVFACTLEKLNKNPVTETVIEIDDPLDLLNCRANIDYDGDGPARSRSSGHRVSNFRSDHRGGANFLFADGSVHFIPDNVEPFAYRGMSTIAGGEVYENPFQE